MSPADALRILLKTITSGSPKQKYWDYQAHRAYTACDGREAIQLFRKEMRSSLLSYWFNSTQPVQGENHERQRAALDWILRAQASTPDALTVNDGVSLGYFPCYDRTTGWKPAYPETTGYIAQSVLEYAAKHELAEVRDAALAMMRWEAEVQMPSGAVQGGPLCPPDAQVPAIFNTGMVLQGWTAAWRSSPEEVFAVAGRKAADFLVNDLNEEGHFQSHGAFVTEHAIKTYNVLCAWALQRFGEDMQDEKYTQAAATNVRAAMKLQDKNGWFSDNCLTNPTAPLTHTIGYTLQGVLEVGLCQKNEEFIASARRGAKPILDLIHDNGYLAGRIDRQWRPAVFSSCLTGSAQIAIVMYRLYEYLGDKDFLDGADRLTNFLKGTQNMDSEDGGIRGAIAGSLPISGSYMTGGYPNWATKYYLDALMHQERLSPNQ